MEVNPWVPQIRYEQLICFELSGIYLARWNTLF